MKLLVAAVGNAWLTDQAFGMKVVEQLQLNLQALPPGTVLADWSFGTVTAFQRLSEHEWDRAIFVSGTPRGRPAGTLHRFTPDLTVPPPEEVHARVGDGVMGAIVVDNLLVLASYYRRLPADVVCIEGEPADEAWGEHLSSPLAAALPAAVSMVVEELTRPKRASR